MPSRLKTQPWLLDWKPPIATVEFCPEDVRGASIAVTLTRALAQAMKDCKLERDKIAEKMTAFLGGPPVTKTQLDVYAAQSRPDHTIPVTRFMALISATRDRRLLQLIADEFGWAVIEKRHLHLIEAAEIREQMDTLKRQHQHALAKAGRR